MLVVEHGRVAHSLAGWQIAVVVLRYFVAVLMLGEWVRTGPAPVRGHGLCGFFEDDVQRSTQVESTDVVCDPSGIQFLVP
jgi:hypothetical protein